MSKVLDSRGRFGVWIALEQLMIGTELFLCYFDTRSYLVLLRHTFGCDDCDAAAMLR